MPVSQKRKLGQSEIEITPIGLGAWQFSQGRGGARGQWGPISPHVTDEIVGVALEGGINWFDTAEIYGGGRSERALAKALQNQGEKDGEVVIATKWFPLFRWANSISKTISLRKEALSPYPIDLHQIHFPGSFSSIEAQMDILADLIDQSEIKTAGVSNFSARQMQRAHEQLTKRGYYLATNQVEYNLLNRKIETNGVLELAQELGITIIAYSPLAMGLLSGKFHKNPELLNNIPFIRRMRISRQIEESRELILTLEEIAQTHQVSASQVALNWLIAAHGESIVAIPGASKPEHAKESAAVMGFQLSGEEIQRIDRSSQEFR